MKVLVLGGTSEAHELCLALRGAGIDFLHSRAGVLENPTALPYPHRDGGFGGAEGLADFLAAEGFTHVVLATHPFARRIAAHARRAAEIRGLPLRALDRAPWLPPPGADWRCFACWDDLVDALPRCARVFLTVGRKPLGAFLRRTDLWFLVRVIEPSGVPVRGIEIVARPPFEHEGEVALMLHHRIDCLVTRNSGGPLTRAKIDAAARLGLPVYLLQREDDGAPDASADIPEIIAWLRAPSLRISSSEGQGA